MCGECIWLPDKLDLIIEFAHDFLGSKFRHGCGRAFLSFTALVLLGLLLSIASHSRLSAHSLNESYIFLECDRRRELSGRIEVNSRDLARVFSTDDEDVAPWSREEIEGRKQANLRLFRRPNVVAGRRPNLFRKVHRISPFWKRPWSDGSEFAQLLFESTGQLTQTPETIEMSYDFMFSDIDPRPSRGLALDRKQQPNRC